MRVKKPDKRKVQGAETKKRLYEAAERLFSERNYSEVSVEDITDEAGITKGAFYVHFESKDALIALLIADRVARVDTDYKTFLDGLPDDMPTSELLLALTDKIADVLMNNIGYENMKKTYQILLAENMESESMTGYNRELYSMFQTVLDKGIQRGEIKNTLTAEALSRHFVIGLRGICYQWCIQYPDFDLKKQAKEHCRLLIEGIIV